MPKSAGSALPKTGVIGRVEGIPMMKRRLPFARLPIARPEYHKVGVENGAPARIQSAT